jgi:hypothetical protein
LSLQNGGYPSPPAVKRQFRDPYGNWWDPQERRNYGEPVHEDNDVLGQFTPHEYTHFSPGKAVIGWFAFIGAVFALSAAVRPFYPDTPSVPRTFEGGLEKELGGPGAVRVRLLYVLLILDQILIELIRPRKLGMNGMEQHCRKHYKSCKYLALNNNFPNINVEYKNYILRGPVGFVSNGL